MQSWHVGLKGHPHCLAPDGDASLATVAARAHNCPPAEQLSTEYGILTRGPLPLKRTSQHALAIAVSGQDIFFPPSCTAQVGPSDPTYTVDRIAPRLGDYSCSVECIQPASHNFQPHEYPTEHRAQTLTLPRSSARAAGVTSPEGRRTVPRSEGASKGAPSFGTARLGPAKTS